MTTTTPTKNDRHHGLQKTCPCGRTKWAKCPHSWYLRYTPKGLPRMQVKIDEYAGSHVDLKADAEELAIEIKAKVKDGTYATRREAPAPATDTALTVRGLGELFFAGAKNRRTGKALNKDERQRWALLMATTIVRAGTRTEIALGDIPAAALTSFDIEAFRDKQSIQREVTVFNKRWGKTYRATRGGTKSVNRAVTRWRAVYAWGVRLGHVENTPFLKGGLPIIGKFGEQRRERRLVEGEYERLMAVSPANIRDLIDVAINTCTRKGELLGLRWHQVRWLTDEIVLTDTKNGKGRLLPMIGPVRAILERRRLDPDGEPYGPLAYVFSNGVGQRPSQIKSAWTTARLRASGFTGQIRDAKTRNQTPEAKAALKALNLHWHDLRREGGSGLVDDGMDVRAVQVFLGHSNLATTNTYLRLSEKALRQEATRVDERRAERAKQAQLVCAGIEPVDAAGATTTATEADEQKSKAS